MHEHENRCLGVILLLKIEQGHFDCVQLVLGVEKKAPLPDFG
jgi:hypothetical protein